MKKILYFLFAFLILLLMFLILLEPTLCKSGAIRGILLCGRIIIPSLFPFMTCVLFLIKSNTLKFLNSLSPITLKLFGINGELFAITLLSFIGGYPVGARLLNEAVENGQISPKNASVMLNFCTNAGPAFIIAAIGNGIFSSNIIGLVLFFSHLLASFILCLLSKKCYKKENQKTIHKSEKLNPIDNFVLSVASASSSVISICSFVILFSVINSYIFKIGQAPNFIKIICSLLEITNAVTMTRNLYQISFFLGFGGICVWFQIFSLCKKMKINIFSFCLFRILHGILSSFLTLIAVKIFNITVPVFSNQSNFSTQLLYDTPALALSMLILGIVFAVSITTKYNCKLLQDVV